jgi:glycosyltransferase involved in cell wall biosynthesis
MTAPAQPGRADDAPEQADAGRTGAAPAAAGRSPSIEVALATYNSERFLAELLDSLFAQTRQDFTLVVADDGSADRTLDILDDYSGRHEGRIRIVAAGPGPRGVLANFGRLIDNVAADYVLLCDHDDVWLPEKIALSLERLQALEARQPPGTPLLVHTDLVVVGPQLEVLGPSFFRYSNIDPRRNDLVRLLLANVVTGCATIVNRALYERARPIPPQAMMYDHWLALVAATFGAIDYLDRPTILYRQHGGNVIGAQRPGTASTMERVRQTLFSDRRRSVMMRYCRQAGVLLERFGGEMTAEQRRATATLATLWSVGRWRRFARLRRSRLGLKGFVRNAALFIVVTRGGRAKPGA